MLWPGEEEGAGRDQHGVRLMLGGDLALAGAVGGNGYGGWRWIRFMIRVRISVMMII